MTSVYWPGVDETPLENYSFGDSMPLTTNIGQAAEQNNDGIPLPTDDFMPPMDDYADCDALLEQSLSIQELGIGRPTVSNGMPIDDVGMLQPSLVSKYASFDPQTAAQAHVEAVSRAEVAARAQYQARVAAAEAARAAQVAETALAQAELYSPQSPGWQLTPLINPRLQQQQQHIQQLQLQQHQYQPQQLQFPQHQRENSLQLGSTPYAPPIYGNVDAYLGVDLSAAQVARSTGPGKPTARAEIYATPARPKRMPDHMLDFAPGELPARSLFTAPVQPVQPPTPQSAERDNSCTRQQEISSQDNLNKNNNASAGTGTGTSTGSGTGSSTGTSTENNRHESSRNDEQHLHRSIGKRNSSGNLMEPSTRFEFPLPQTPRQAHTAPTPLFSPRSNKLSIQPPPPLEFGTPGGMDLGLGLGLSLGQGPIVGNCPTTPSRHPPLARAAPVTPYGRSPWRGEHVSPGYGLASPKMRSPGLRSPSSRSPKLHSPRSPVMRSPVASRSPAKLSAAALEWQPILTISDDAHAASQQIIRTQAAAAAETKCKRRTNLPPGTVDEYVSGPGADQQWQCLYPHCGRLFKRRYNLRSHIQTHLCDRPYSCEMCTATFVRPHDLRRHERCHSTERPFTCPCGKGFTRLDALQRHKYRQICVGGLTERDVEPQSDTDSFLPKLEETVEA